MQRPVVETTTPVPSPELRAQATHPLRELARQETANRPAVYRFIGPRGEILYIGKSVRLRSRLLSYFRPDVPPKVRELLRVAVGLEWEYVPNEFEALLREFRHIRAFQPRFNRQHRRDRRFAWIRITNESAPRMVATRRPAPGGLSFGPFPARRGLPSLLGELSTVLRLRDCAAGTKMRFADQVELFSDPLTPACPRADLGNCAGPCAARCSVSDYRANVTAAADFLAGETDRPLIALEGRMRSAAARREFETAARLRDREARLRSLRDEVVFYRDFLQSLSFVYRVPSEASGPDRGYAILGGQVHFSFSFDEGATVEGDAEDPEARLRELLSRPPPPADRMDDLAREEVFLVSRWFRWRPEELDRTVPFRVFPG